MMLIAEQLPIQELGCIDKGALCQALPPLDLGLSSPRPPGLTVVEVRGASRGKSRYWYQKKDECMLIGQKQHMSYSQNSSGKNPKKKPTKGHIFVIKGTILSLRGSCYMKN